MLPSRPLSRAGQQIGFHFLADRFGFYGKVLIVNVKMRSFFCGLRYERGQTPSCSLLRVGLSARADGLRYQLV